MPVLRRNVPSTRNTTQDTNNIDDFQSPSTSPNPKRARYSGDNNSALSEIRMNSADTAVEQIKNDKHEAQQMIVEYGIDPVEILHMGKFFRFNEFYSV